jgi:hypothetical protein
MSLMLSALNKSKRMRGSRSGPEDAYNTFISGGDCADVMEKGSERKRMHERELRAPCSNKGQISRQDQDNFNAGADRECRRERHLCDAHRDSEKDQSKRKGEREGRRSRNSAEIQRRAQTALTGGTNLQRGDEEYGEKEQIKRKGEREGRRSRNSAEIQRRAQMALTEGTNLQREAEERVQERLERRNRAPMMFPSLDRISEGQPADEEGCFEANSEGEESINSEVPASINGPPTASTEIIELVTMTKKTKEFEAVKVLKKAKALDEGKTPTKLKRALYSQLDMIENLMALPSPLLSPVGRRSPSPLMQMFGSSLIGPSFTVNLSDPPRKQMANASDCIKRKRMLQPLKMGPTHHPENVRLPPITENLTSSYSVPEGQTKAVALQGGGFMVVC